MSVSVCRDPNAPIATVVLNRPKVKNAVDRPTAEALSAAFRELDADDSIRAVVLYGEGGTFCAGADLKAFAGENRNRLDPNGDGPMGPTRMLMSKPTIAAISGHAVAGGLELALWCDLRVIEASSTMGVFCRRVGVPLIDGGTIRLPRLIGLSRALDLILTGRAVKAEEALAIGLANRVVDDGQSRAEAEALAISLSEFPQAALRCDRQSAYEQSNLDLETALANEFKGGLAALAEAAEGAQKFASGQGRHGAKID